MSSPGLLRNLKALDATALVVGTIIGTGVFLKTSPMAQWVGSPFWVLAAWAVAGALSLTGALVYAELGSLFPRAGGEFVFLKETYHPLVAFLYGWSRLWIVTPGSIAAYSIGAAIFLDGLFPMTSYRQGVAITLIAFFTMLNCFSVAFGGRLQSVMTAIKILMIGILIVAVLGFSPTGTWQNLSNSTGEWQGISAFGMAVLAALWAFDGWNNLPMAAGEVENPGRNIPRALCWGLLAVLISYAAVNVTYFYALPFDEIVTASSTSYPEALPVATKALQSLGAWAVIFISAAFVFSALGAMNGSMLAGSRVPYAMALDGLFLKSLSRLNPKTRVPVVSVLFQGGLAALLALTGTFDQLTDYVVFASWIFYALVTGSLFILRHRRPDLVRPFRTPGYPWVPIVFLISSLFLLMNTLLTSPKQSLIGIGLLGLGVPVYFAFFKSSKT